MKIFIGKISKLILVFLILVSGISYLSLYILKHSSFYKSSFLVNDVSQEEFDYIILGASEGLTTLNTKHIDSILDFEGLNLSMDDTSMSSHYLMLQHFLAEKKKTNYCILVSSPKGFDLQKNNANNNDYRFLMYNDRSYVSGYYNQFSDRKSKIMYYSKWIPFLGLSYYNAELFYPSLVALTNNNKRNRFDNKGNYSYPNSGIEDKLIDQREEIHVQFSNSFFSRIQELCKENDIELICYLPPVKTRKAVLGSTPFKVVDHSDELNNVKYFFDERHVNSSGRDLASLHFVEDFIKIANK